MAPLPPDAGIGIYIHVPFCSHICPYCDFNTYAGLENLIPRYVEAVVRDLAAQAPVFGGRPVSTIFFGGGTPSLLEPAAIARIMQAARLDFAIEPDAEVTLEANPNSVDPAYFAGLREAGVNRISLGVQSTHRRGLRVLGRQHEAVDARAAVAAARAAGLENLSLDLIFGWPGQTLDDWRRDLDNVLDWPGGPPVHVSLYGLIVEPGTPMADAVGRGILVPVDDDATADMYEHAIAFLGDHGWSHYEVANWAAPSPGDRDGLLPTFASRHNALYWRNGDYVGIGAGAHGHLAGRRTMNHLAPGAYIAAIEQGKPAAANVEALDRRTQMGETMRVGLRLLGEGVGEDAFRLRHAMTLDDVFGETIAGLLDLGLLERSDGRVRLTHRGLMLANDVCARFL